MARPKQPILSRDLIRDQALAIIDEDGLEALTMRRLAKRLDVQAASLYTHFPNKDAVLSAIAARLAKRIETTGFADSWQEGLRRWATTYYGAIHWHPNAAPVVAGRGGVDTSVADEIRSGLVRHGWRPADAGAAADAVKFLVLGAAAATGSREGSEELDSTPPGAVGPTAARHREAFIYALDRLIDGLESDRTIRPAVDGQPSPAPTVETPRRRPRTA